MQRILVTLLSAVALASCGPSSSTPSGAKTAASNAVRLMAGYEKHHHPITTASKEAQQLFDQGVALVFAFNHEEAVKSFTRAADLDRDAAMPHWGVAWALGPNYNLDIDDPRSKQAFDAITRASALAAQAPEHERAYIEHVLQLRGGVIEGVHGAARVLGLAPSTLRSLMKRLGIKKGPTP